MQVSSRVTFSLARSGSINFCEEEMQEEEEEEEEEEKQAVSEAVSDSVT